MPVTHSATAASRTVRALRDPKKAAFFPRFFKTGPGEYGEGDHFLGVTVPQVRSVVREFHDLPLNEVAALLSSKWHEERLLGFLILVDQSRRGTPALRQKLLSFTLKHLDAMNNWDLVDASAPDLIGIPLIEKGSHELLWKLAKSKKLWRERVSMVATYAFIRRKEMRHTLKLAEHFLSHRHDLMHKASGWMLREMGKRDVAALHRFLKKHAHVMPRTMLRYAIEKFPENVRKKYLQKK